MGIVGVLLLGTTFYQAQTQHYNWSIDASRAYVTDRVQPGETILFPEEYYAWLWTWHFIEPGQIRPRITLEVTTADGVTVAAFGGRALHSLFQPGQTYWIIWEKRIKTPDLSMCEPYFAEDQTIAIAPTWIQRVVVRADALQPICGGSE